SSRRRHTRFSRDWSSDVCSSDLVELVVTLNLPFSLWGATHHPQADETDRDRGKEDRAPAKVLAHETAKQGAQTRATPGANRPHTDGPLTPGAIPVSFHDSETGWHDARG